MENSRMIKILEMIKNNLDHTNPYASGICYELSLLYFNEVISKDERLLLMAFIRANKPSETQYTEFFNDSEFRQNASFWWKGVYENEKTAKIRKNFIQTLINIHKK